MTNLTLSPFGLFLAAVLSATNVLADVSRKKVVERHELIAATFWVRVFAAIVFSLPIIVFTGLGTPPLIHAPAAIAPEEIKNSETLLLKLKQGADPVSQYVWEQMPESNKQAILEAEQAKNPEPLSKALANGFNKVIEGDSIHQERRFEGVLLSADSRGLIDKEPRFDALAYHNRVLLEDVYPEEISQRRQCALFGLSAWMVPPPVAFGIYLMIDVAFIALAQILLMKALQISPMSLCIPFMSFSPVFLIATAFLVLGEMPPPVKLIGVSLIVVGSFVIHRRLFATGWTAPFEAIIREKGCRYVLLVALILAITMPVEKQLILMSDPLTTAFSNGIGLCLLFGIFAYAQSSNVKAVMRQTPHWAIIAGIFDAGAILLLYVTLNYLALVITISIKRAGIVLAILLGWLIFKEREITDKLIAASVMVGGILIFYLPLEWREALLLAGLVLGGMAVALYATRPQASVPEPVLVATKEA
jgi:uncharacterized membrane protein